MRHRLFELLDADHFVGDRLLLNLSLIGFERYRRRTDIFAAAQCFARSFFAGIGERVAHDVVVFLRWAADLDERFFFGKD